MFGLPASIIPFKPAAAGGGTPALSRSAGSTGGTGVPTFDVGFSPVPASGVLLLAVIANGGGTSVSIAGGGTWTELDSGTAGTQIFYRLCGGSEPANYTITYNGDVSGERCSAVIVEITGANASPIDNHTATNGTGTQPSVTTTQANDLVVVLAAELGGSVSDYTTLAGYTVALRQATGAGGFTRTTATIASKSVAAIGSTSPGTWNAGTGGKLFSVAIKG